MALWHETSLLIQPEQLLHKNPLLMLSKIFDFKCHCYLNQIHLPVREMRSWVTRGDACNDKVEKYGLKPQNSGFKVLNSWVHLCCLALFWSIYEWSARQIQHSQTELPSFHQLKPALDLSSRLAMLRAGLQQISRFGPEMGEGRLLDSSLSAPVLKWSVSAVG